MAAQIIFAFLILLPVFAIAQAEEYTPPKEQSVYLHSVDTLITIAAENNPEKAIVISADQFLLNKLPLVIQEKEIEQTTKNGPSRKYEGYVWIRLENLVLEQDKLYVFAKLEVQEGEQFHPCIPDFDKIRLTYQLDLDANTFELKTIDTIYSQIEE